MTSTDIHTVTLPPQVGEALAAAGGHGINMIVAITDASGNYQFSYRGSTHLDPGPGGSARLSAWLRKKEGSLQSHVAEGADIDVVYRDPRAGAYYRLTGHARLATDAATCEHVYLGSPPQEQMADPRRLGVAMVVDLTRVVGNDATGRVLAEA